MRPGTEFYLVVDKVSPAPASSPVNWSTFQATCQMKRKLRPWFQNEKSHLVKSFLSVVKLRLQLKGSLFHDQSVECSLWNFFNIFGGISGLFVDCNLHCWESGRVSQHQLFFDCNITDCHNFLQNHRCVFLHILQCASSTLACSLAWTGICDKRGADHDMLQVHLSFLLFQILSALGSHLQPEGKTLLWNCSSGAWSWDLPSQSPDQKIDASKEGRWSNNSTWLMRWRWRWSMLGLAWKPILNWLSGCLEKKNSPEEQYKGAPPGCNLLPDLLHLLK